MPKLQKITRTNGSCVYSVNIPLEVIEELNWGKGDIVSVEVLENGGIRITLESKED